MFNFSLLEKLELSIFCFMKEISISESVFSKIDKGKQPELKCFYLCSNSGEFLFDLNKNIGWPKLENLTFNG